MSNWKPLVIHHNDNDGFCSALLAKKALPEGTEFVETNYGQEPPDVTGRDVFILDFHYPRATLEAMQEVANTIIVLDHHKTAQADLAGLDFCVFNMDKSGCRLTQELFSIENNWLIDYVEDRDLWKWQLENSKEINAALSSYPKTFDEWENLWNRDVNELIGEGTAILRYQTRIVETLCSKAEDSEIAGYNIPVVNSPILQSEIAGALAKDKPFAAVFFVLPDGTRVYSLRSDKNGIDVSEIAKSFPGGGGHARAAGFQVKFL